MDPFPLYTYLPDVIWAISKCHASLEALLHFSEASFHHILDTRLHSRPFINMMYTLVKLTLHAVHKVCFVTEQCLLCHPKIRSYD